MFWMLFSVYWWGCGAQFLFLRGWYFRALCLFMRNQTLVPHSVCASPLETGTACSHGTICSELDRTPINGSAGRKHHNDIWQPPSPGRLERSETHPVIHYSPTQYTTVSLQSNWTMHNNYIMHNIPEMQIHKSRETEWQCIMGVDGYVMLNMS